MTEIIDAAPVTVKSPAAQIREHHLLAHQHKDKAIEHARQAGGLLLKVKASLGHGAWLEWLEANVPFNVRTAQRYMAVAAPEPKCDKVSYSRPRNPPRRLTGKALAQHQELDRVRRRDQVVSHVAFVVSEIPRVGALRADDVELLRKLRDQIDVALGGRA